MKPILVVFLSGMILGPASFAQRGPAVVRQTPSAPPAISLRSLAQHPWLDSWVGRGLRSNAGTVWGAPFIGTNPQFADECCSCEAGEPQSVPQSAWPEPGPLLLAPPEPPVRAVIHEYNWPAAPPSAAAFAIVTKDGQVRRAAAVWRTDTILHFSGVDGREGSVKLDSIDTEATRRLNAQAGLAWPMASR